jgi:hypothetical protein
MKRTLIIIFLAIGLALTNFASIASAGVVGPDGGPSSPAGGTTTTSSGTSKEVCPAGATSNEDLGTCAQCQTTTGCIDPTTDCTNATCKDSASTTCTQTDCNLVTSYLDPLINLLAGCVGVACVISIIMAGIQYTTSAGDSGKAAAARGRITTTIVAFIMFTFLWSFLQFIVPGGYLNK